MALRMLIESVAAEHALSSLVRVTPDGNLAVTGRPFDLLRLASPDLESFTHWGAGTWDAAVLTGFPDPAPASARLRVVVALLGYSYDNPSLPQGATLGLHCDREEPHRDLSSSLKPPQFVAFASKDSTEGSVISVRPVTGGANELLTLGLRRGEVVVLNNLRLLHLLERPLAVESALLDTEPDESWLAF